MNRRSVFAGIAALFALTGCNRSDRVEPLPYRIPGVTPAVSIRGGRFAVNPAGLRVLPLVVRVCESEPLFGSEQRCYETGNDDSAALQAAIGLASQLSASMNWDVAVVVGRGFYGISRLKDRPPNGKEINITGGSFYYPGFNWVSDDFVFKNNRFDWAK